MNVSLSPLARSVPPLRFSVFVPLPPPRSGAGPRPGQGPSGLESFLMVAFLLVALAILNRGFDLRRRRTCGNGGCWRSAEGELKRAAGGVGR